MKEYFIQKNKDLIKLKKLKIIINRNSFKKKLKIIILELKS